MENDNFPFVADVVLKKNINLTFEHIIRLTVLIDSGKYDTESVSSFRLTTIISTAGVIEALLFYLVKRKFTPQEIKEHYATWEFKNKNVLHIIKEGKSEVVAGNYILKSSKIVAEKMNFGQLCKFLNDKDLLANNFESLEKVRILRNEQHLGSRKVVSNYGQKAMLESFETAGNIKELVKSLTT